VQLRSSSESLVSKQGYIVPEFNTLVNSNTSKIMMAIEYTSCVVIISYILYISGASALPTVQSESSLMNKLRIQDSAEIELSDNAIKLLSSRFDRLVLPDQMDEQNENNFMDAFKNLIPNIENHPKITPRSAVSYKSKNDGGKKILHY